VGENLWKHKESRKLPIQTVIGFIKINLIAKYPTLPFFTLNKIEEFLNYKIIFTCSTTKIKKVSM
jgi:hypothetical protein